MSGLLLKDILVLKKQSMIMGVLLVFYGVLSVYNQNIMMFAYMSALFAFFLPMNSLAYDDRCEWNKYALCTPITPSTIVYSKYVLSLLVIVATSLLSVLLAFVIHKKVSTESLEMILSGLYLGIGIISIYLPTCFKFGVEKSRYIIVAICMIPSFIALALSNSEILVAPSQATVDLLFQLAPIIMLVVLILSVLISKRIMNKKEY